MAAQVKLESHGKVDEQVRHGGTGQHFRGDESGEHDGEVARVVGEMAPQSAGLPPAVVCRPVAKAEQDPQDQRIQESGLETPVRHLDADQGIDPPDQQGVYEYREEAEAQFAGHVQQW